MPTSPYKMQFGWEGDDGLGERLIKKIIAGEKTATCAPIFDFTDEELQQTYAARGKLVVVVDKDKNPHCTVEMIDVFETTFGNPHPVLLKGEGFEGDTHGFQETHRQAWADWLSDNNLNLNDDTVLVVEQFRILEM